MVSAEYPALLPATAVASPEGLEAAATVVPLLEVPAPATAVQLPGLAAVPEVLSTDLQGQ